MISKENVPGPGQYNSTLENKGPKFSMGVKNEKLKKDADNPGPGHVKVGYEWGSGHQVKWHQESKMKKDKYANGVPGPGSYKQGGDSGTQGVSMKFRHE